MYFLFLAETSVESRSHTIFKIGVEPSKPLPHGPPNISGVTLMPHECDSAPLEHNELTFQYKGTHPKKNNIYMLPSGRQHHSDLASPPPQRTCPLLIFLTASLSNVLQLQHYYFLRYRAFYDEKIYFCIWSHQLSVL